MAKLSQPCREGNWWRGKLNGKTGSFPASMVEILITTTNTNLAAGKLRKRLSERMSTVSVPPNTRLGPRFRRPDWATLATQTQRDLAAMKLTDSGTERPRAGSRRESRYALLQRSLVSSIHVPQSLTLRWRKGWEASPSLSK